MNLNLFKSGLLKIFIAIMLGLLGHQLSMGQIVVSGSVSDAESGVSLPGANVLERGTLNGTVTDIDGNFTISVAESSATLVFSFIGYESLEKQVGTRTIINVSLSSGINLDEVLVVGYGTQKKESVVGAISQVEGDVLVSSGTNNVSTAIAGKLSGVVTLQTDGKPGEEEPKIFIRGAATWNNTDPLVMVDGIERSSWSEIDPNAIKSITVLKDASATAVYGAKGGNGVILITTKRGLEGKPEFSFSYSHGFKQISDQMSMLDASTTIPAYNDALRNDNLWDLLYSQDAINHYRTQDDPISYPSVNWIDEMFKIGHTDNLNLSVTGGTEKVNYFVSLGYLHDGDIINVEKQGDFDPRNYYNRYNMRSNLDFKLTKSTTLSTNISGSVQNRNRPSEMNRGGHSLVWVGIYTSAVNSSPLYYPPSVLEEYPDPNEPDANGVRYPFFNNGHLHDNPYSMLYTVGFENQDQFILNSDLVLKQDLSSITKGLSAQASISYGTNSEYHRYIGEGSGNEIAPRYRLTIYDDESYLWQRRPDYHEDLPNLAFTEESQNFYIRNLYYDVQANYNRTFASDHYLTALGIFRRKQVNRNTQEPYKEEAWSGRLTYAYKLKYLFETNLGYNGSESFAPGNRFGFFPAFAVGWNIAEESYIKDNLTFINRLKIRYSYGKVGVDNVSRWLYYQNYSEGTFGSSIAAGNGLGAYGAWYSTNTGYIEGPVANTLAQWETAVKQNIGIELGVFKKVSLSVDLFKEDRDNILQTPNTVPELAALEFKELNMGITKSHGFEIEASYIDTYGSDFHINLNAKYSFSENRVVFRDDPPGLPLHQRSAGYPIGQPRVMLSDGRYTSVDDINNYTQPGTNASAIGSDGYPVLYFYGTGDEKYIDYNGDGIVDGNDAAADLYPSYPLSHFSFSGLFRYKGLSFRMLLMGQLKKTSILEDELMMPFTTPFPVLYAHETDYYSSSNPNAFFPAPHTGAYGTYNLLNPVYARPVSSFLRIKELELSYDFKMPRKQHLKNLKIFINTNNLFTYSPNTYFGDPEKAQIRPGADGSYPLLRRYNMGIKIAFN